MENHHYYRSESDDDKENNSSSKKPAAFSLGPSVYRAPETPPVERPRRPEHGVPLEGIISWRDRSDEELRHRLIEEGFETKKDHTEDTEEDEGEKKPVLRTVQPPRAVIPPRQSVEAQQQDLVEEQNDPDEEEDSQTGQRADADALDFPAIHENDDRQFAEFDEGNKSDDEQRDQLATSTNAVFSGAALDTEQAQAPASKFNQYIPPAFNNSSEFVNDAPHDDEPTHPTSHAPISMQPQQPSTHFAPPNPNQPNTQTYNVWNQPTHVAGVHNGNMPPVNQGMSLNVGSNQPPTPPNVPSHNVSGGGFNQQPPHGFPTNPNTPGNPYFNPNVGGDQYTATPVMPIEHPNAAYTSNRDPRLGPVAATLGLGLVAEHFGRKRADRKLEKRVNERSDEQFKEQNKQMAASNRQMHERQRQFSNEQERQAAELKQVRLQESPAGYSPVSTSEVAAQPPQPQSFETAQTIIQNSIPAENVSPRPSGFAPTHSPRHPQPVRVEQFSAPQQSMSAESFQQNVSDQHQQEAQPSQHVEHSSWHNIVVDERGNEVAGAVQYGEGFQRERQQEVRSSSMNSSSTSGSRYSSGSGSQQNSTGGAYVGVTPHGALPSGMTNPTLPAGHPTHVDPQHQIAASQRQQANTNMTNPWFWIMLLLIIAAFFTAAMV